MVGQMERLLINWIVCALTANNQRYSPVRTIIYYYNYCDKQKISFQKVRIKINYPSIAPRTNKLSKVTSCNSIWKKSIIALLMFFFFFFIILTDTIINLPLADSAVWNYGVLLKISDVFGTCLLAIVWTRGPGVISSTLSDSPIRHSI